MAWTHENAEKLGMLQGTCITIDKPYLYTFFGVSFNSIFNYGKDESILNQFSSYHPRLQFAIETSKNKVINFLDITLMHMQD